MKTFRFMSKEEFEKYKNGENLINNRKHIGRTTSKGFCFLNIEDHKPEDALHFLSGIATMEVLAVFETNKKLNKTKGTYAVPIKMSENSNPFDMLFDIFCKFNESFETTEYCTTNYNNKDFKLIKYSENVFSNWKPYEEQTNIKWKEV